jgi:hypothetical protein
MGALRGSLPRPPPLRLVSVTGPISDSVSRGLQNAGYYASSWPLPVMSDSEAKPWSNEDESWLNITARAKTLNNSHQNLNQLKVDES